MPLTTKMPVMLWTKERAPYARQALCEADWSTVIAGVDFANGIKSYETHWHVTPTEGLRSYSGSSDDAYCPICWPPMVRDDADWSF